MCVRLSPVVPPLSPRICWLANVENQLPTSVHVPCWMNALTSSSAAPIWTSHGNFPWYVCPVPALRNFQPNCHTFDTWWCGSPPLARQGAELKTTSLINFSKETLNYRDSCNIDTLWILNPSSALKRIFPTKGAVTHWRRTWNAVVSVNFIIGSYWITQVATGFCCTHQLVKVKLICSNHQSHLIWHYDNINHALNAGFHSCFLLMYFQLASLHTILLVCERVKQY